MADHYAEVYAQHADQYELLVSREDYEGNILKTLREIAPLEGLDVVDLGSGTGRVACLLAPFARSVRAFDASAHMLEIARAKLAASGLRNWRVDVADHRAVPLEDHAADVIISGWSIVYTVVWEDDWQTELNKALAEMQRVVRPGGTVIILETQGTGFTAPHPPQPVKKYFAYLDAAGFASTWIRTDYKFVSVAEAQNLTSFFFEDDMSDRLISQNPAILPECTGVWWKR